jgi:hypothetical protein
MGADGFTSPPKEILLRIFIALKIHRPHLNPGTLGPMASTTAIPQPRTMLWCESTLLVNLMSIYLHTYFLIYNSPSRSIRICQNTKLTISRVSANEQLRSPCPWKSERYAAGLVLWHQELKKRAKRRVTVYISFTLLWQEGIKITFETDE